jgi:hypothetical protein
MTTLVSSPKFKTFAIVFAITAAVLYVLCDLFALPAFSFHPATYRLEWGYGLPRLNEGPVMYWYGWTVTTLIGATVVGLLATLVPENATRKIPLFLIWVLPILAVPVLIWSLMPFWTK